MTGSPIPIPIRWPALVAALSLAVAPAGRATASPGADAAPGEAEGEAAASPALTEQPSAVVEAAPAEVQLALPELLRRAVDDSPMVWAADAGIEAARTVSDQVSAYPVPTVGITAMGFPGDEMSGYGEIWYTASQMFPLGDALDRRAEAADAAVGEAQAERIALQLDLVLQIRLAWVELAKSLADARVVDDQIETIRDMARIANNAYAAGLGMGSQADALRARAEVPMLEDERRMAEAMATSARAMIAAMAALDEREAPAEPLPLDPDTYEAPALAGLEDLLGQAVERRPEFAALEARAEAAVAMGRVAAEERLPDLMLEGGVQQRLGGDMPPVAFMLGVSITLPWVSSGQYEAMEAQARAMGRMIEADGDGLRLAIQSELRQQIARYEQLAAGLELTRKTIRHLRQAENAAVAAYTAGNGDFDAILDLESSLLESRRSLVEAVYEIQAVRARIDRIVARPVDEQIDEAEGW